MFRSKHPVNSFLSVTSEIIGSCEIPAPQRLSAHFIGGSRRPLLLSWLPGERRSKRRSRRPGALLYGRPTGLASAILRNCEIICPFLGRSEPFPRRNPAAVGITKQQFDGKRRGAGGESERILIDTPIAVHQLGWNGVVPKPNRSAHQPKINWQYNASVIRLRPRHPRFGVLPDRRSTPGPAADHPPPPADGESGDRS